MKNLLLMCFAALFLGMTAIGQDNEYTATIDGWEVDFDKAYEMSQESGKPILANFTGSDWCGWCKRLKRNVFDKSEFQEWADENVILLELDYPRRKQIPQDIKKQNAQLQRQFKIRGFPTIWVFNINKEEGKYKIEQLGRGGYKATPDEFISDMNKILKRDI